MEDICVELAIAAKLAITNNSTIDVSNLVIFSLESCIVIANGYRWFSTNKTTYSNKLATTRVYNARVCM